MADFPLHGAQKYLAAGQSTVTTTLGALAANAAANTKGSYVAALSAANNTQVSAGLMVQLTASAQFMDYLVDIALGGAGSEQVVMPNLLFTTLGLGGSASYFFPIAIPSGQRVAVRCQCSTGSQQVTIGLHLFAQGTKPSAPLGTVATYGANTADSGAVSVDPGGSAHTKGSYSEITSATTRDLSGLVVALGNQTNSARVSAHWLVDIAIGGSGSESVLIPNLYARIVLGTDTILSPQAHSYLPIQIPEGTRIAARAQCTITDATDRLIDVAAYGVG